MAAAQRLDRTQVAFVKRHSSVFELADLHRNPSTCFDVDICFGYLAIAELVQSL